MFKKKNKNETEPEVKEEVKKEPAKPVEEWVWVDGYKGTDEWMQCRDGFQYELHKTYDIPEDKEVVLCEYGFHLCLELNDVFRYYDFCANNRFFKVKALVRKSDLKQYSYGYYKHASTDLLYPRMGTHKLAAKSIIFTEEVILDELCKIVGIEDWTEDQKKLAHNLGVDKARAQIQTEKLIELGYSEAFSRLIVRDNYYDLAHDIGTQEGLSMDMKVWAILTYETKKRKR